VTDVPANPANEAPAPGEEPAQVARQGRAVPWLTSALLALNVAVAAGIQVSGGRSALQQWGWKPAFEVWRGKAWVLVTSAFVHLDALHLVLNLYWLWVLGGIVEQILPRTRMAAFVFAAAAVSSAAQLALTDQTGIGFSGVCYALFGLAWVVSALRPDLGIRVPPRLFGLFAVWLVLGFVGTWLKIVNFGNVAHLAGGLFGACAGLAMAPRWQQLGLGGIGGMAAATIAAAAWAPWSPSWTAARAISAYERADHASALRWLDAASRRGQDPAWVAEMKALAHAQQGQVDAARVDLAVLRSLNRARAEELARKLAVPDISETSPQTAPRAK